MNGTERRFSSGFPGLDEILQGIRAGDNVVWQVDAIEDYTPFVHAFAAETKRRGQSLVYFRFADHPELVPPEANAQVHRLHPEEGFESFVLEIFEIIERRGYGVCYVFDSLSELAVDWYSDRMLGNFFLLTCPYLFELETVAYFGLLRNLHTPHATEAIHRTAQVVLDAYRNREKYFVQPIKVDKRYSDTMYMLHCCEEDRLVPVTRSVTIAEILASVPQPWLDLAAHRADVWTRSFERARDLVAASRASARPPAGSRHLLRQLLRMSVARDPRLLKLAERYLDLSDVVEVGRRMIGTGLIGGKSVGMLLARAILRRNDPRWAERLEPHDSFFVGSDVFSTYLIENKCWSIRRRLHAGETPPELEETRQRLRAGKFPKDIEDQFAQMLAYFGQSPIIVRSSSILEDAYGNAFSGKYESVFLANQGTPRERIEELMNAVRTVYVSTLGRDALAYRAHWGLMEKDEQMSLLIQRVSGAVYGNLFYPQVAGVGFSFNPYVWTREIDPADGVLRLVLGLGTRAVNRTEDDYTRVVGLSAPARRPEAGMAEIRRFSQRRADVLDLRENSHAARAVDEVVRASPGLPKALFFSPDLELEASIRERGGRPAFTDVLTFDEMLADTTFAVDMRDMLRCLHRAYRHPVDIEFTANFLEDGTYKVNLLQCRPFQVAGRTRRVRVPRQVPAEDTILRSSGPIVGNSVELRLDRIICVVPAAYGALPMSDRYSIARLIGAVAHADAGGRRPKILLIGPGRWGTSTPALGVPVSFSEIGAVSALCEVALMREGLVPDLSLGTHFLNDLVELDILCMAVHPERAGDLLSGDFFEREPNALAALVPGAERWSHAVKVIEQAAGAPPIVLSADVVEQRGMCYRASPRAAAP